ncbi:MAG: multiheme c-type cytochrome, partial [Verrucomicrobia bacterium]|nr:multiheme c-type cytochrome [Verrucomicrobiota bacterium]
MPGKKKLLIVISASGALVVLALSINHRTSPRHSEPAFTFGGPTGSPDPKAQECATCHAREVDAWHGSQHARAMRVVQESDAGRFASRTHLEHGSFTTTPIQHGHALQFEQRDGKGAASTHTALAVIAVEPLIQYLTPFPGGRLQCVDAAYDVLQNNWFHVFGKDVREPHEWGFWKNRSMTWNARCASCHMTNFRKGYDFNTDRYDSTWDAMGISCAQCHGDMRGHATASEDAHTRATRLAMTPQQRMEACMSCHARREDLTGDFMPGERFEDHYRLALLTDPGLFFADGQIQDEVFEATSFASSAMFDKGVTCLHCHDPHSAKTLLPPEQNQLCMTCHTAPGAIQGPIIEALAHSHHAAGSTGNQCISCHMATTTYMMRDPRRDHGFIIPDPLLTIEHGIPNACNRCHEDQSAEWALAHCETWYGERMQRRTRERARVIARAQAGDLDAIPALVGLAGSESNAVWKASMLSLLSTLSTDAATPILFGSLTNESALVRSVAVRALAPLPQAREWLAPLRADPARLVRLDAAWGTLGAVDRSSDVYLELRRYLAFDVDQPSGALKQAQLALAERRTGDVDPWLDKIVAWDPSAGSFQMKGR